MAGIPKKFPPIPDSTLQQARSVFGRDNPFLYFGDHLEDFFDCGSISGQQLVMPTCSGNHLQSTPCLSLITILQFIEGLTDHQVANALRTRFDWKYALHLPPWHIGIEDTALCVFRRTLYHNEELYQIFSHIHERVEQFGIFHCESTGLDSQAILTSICTENRYFWTANEFSLSLSALAANASEWLRNNSLPHWYVRYGTTGVRNLSLTTVTEKADALLKLATDIQIFLEKIESDPELMVKNAHLQALQQLFFQQFFVDEASKISLRPRCSFCLPPGNVKTENQKRERR